MRAQLKFTVSDAINVFSSSLTVLNKSCKIQAGLGRTKIFIDFFLMISFVTFVVYSFVASADSVIVE